MGTSIEDTKNDEGPHRYGVPPFKDAVTKMNLITNHGFVYRRWNENKYRRYPPFEAA
jgi:hypothetical protein